MICLNNLAHFIGNQIKIGQTHGVFDTLRTLISTTNSNNELRSFALSAIYYLSWKNENQLLIARTNGILEALKILMDDPINIEIQKQVCFITR